MNGSSFDQTWIPFTQGCFKDALSQVWLKLDQWFWRKKWKCEKFMESRTTGDQKSSRDFGSSELQKSYTWVVMKRYKKCSQFWKPINNYSARLIDWILNSQFPFENITFIWRRIKAYTWHLWSLSKEGSLSCHTAAVYNKVEV